MRRRSFLKSSAIAAGTTLAAPAIAGNTPPADEKSLFELRVYELAEGPDNKDKLIKYIKEAFIQLLKKNNSNAVVFEPYEQDEPKLYLLIEYPSQSEFYNVQKALTTDPSYLSSAQEYNSIPTSTPVYSRYQSFLLDSFDRYPSLVMPQEERNLFELRTYQSANEDAGRRKVEMFNNEEIDLFLSVGMEPVFFGKIIAGQYMPALIYMVTFKDMEAQEAGWAKFSSSEGWATLRQKPEYANVVSNIQTVNLKPIEL